MKKIDISKFILPVICAVSALLLSLVNQVTAPKIEAYEKSLTQSALEQVSMSYEIGDRTDVEDDKYVSYYHGLYDGNKLVGYICGLKSSGYGGPMTFVASFDTSGSIFAVKMLSNSETPGVGKKSENDGYMDMFIGTGSEIPVPLKKDELSSEAVSVVSGATLTFGGISRALSYASNYIKSL